MSAIDDLQNSVATLTNQLNAATGSRDTTLANIKHLRDVVSSYGVTFAPLNVSNPEKAIFFQGAPVWNPWTGQVFLSTNFQLTASRLPYPEAQPNRQSDSVKNSSNISFLNGIKTYLTNMNTNIDVYKRSLTDIPSYSQQLAEANRQLNILLTPPETAEQRATRLQHEKEAALESQRLANQQELDLKKQQDQADANKRLIYTILLIVLIIVALFIIFKIIF